MQNNSNVNVNKTKQMLREKTKDQNFKQKYQPVIQNAPRLKKAMSKPRKNRNQSIIVASKTKPLYRKKRDLCNEEYAVKTSKSTYGIDLTD